MKAYQIMMFLLIFNLMVWTVDTGLSIYDLDYSDGGKITPESDETLTAEEQQYGLLWSVAKISIAAIVISIMGAAIIGGIFHIEKASQSFVYGAFTALFWISYLQAATVLWAISASVAYAGLIVLAIVSAFIGYVFVVGLFQMVTGGWKSYV